MQPYLLYIKLGAAVVVLLILAGCYWWISSAFSERDRLRISDAEKTAQVRMYSESMARDAALREGINNAIKNIKVSSEVFINEVDAGKTPHVSDGTQLVLIPGGVPKTVPGMPTFTIISTSIRSPVTPSS